MLEDVFGDTASVGQGQEELAPCFSFPFWSCLVMLSRMLSPTVSGLCSQLQFYLPLFTCSPSTWKFSSPCSSFASFLKHLWGWLKSPLSVDSWLQTHSSITSLHLSLHHSGPSLPGLFPMLLQCNSLWTTLHASVSLCAPSSLFSKSGACLFPLKTLHGSHLTHLILLLSPLICSPLYFVPYTLDSAFPRQCQWYLHEGVYFLFTECRQLFPQITIWLTAAQASGLQTPALPTLHQMLLHILFSFLITHHHLLYNILYSCIYLLLGSPS